MRALLSGNEAVARGLFEAGASFCSAYPGTPSTEISENLAQLAQKCAELYCEWAPNEKVAFEAAYGASVAGARAAVAMKHVGLNVAADPLFTSAYDGVGGGFIVISADDPGLHSSQNEQDNRHYARAAKIPMLEPSDSAECLFFVREAFEISERFGTPVLLRLTTRVCHSKSIVEIGERTAQSIKPYEKNIEKNVATPANAKAAHVLLEKRLAALAEYSNASSLNTIEQGDGKFGVVAAGAAYFYAKEAFPKGTAFFKVGMSYPLPMEKIREFAQSVGQLYVVEELDSFMEEQIRAAGIDCIGKTSIPAVWELNPGIVREAVFGESSEAVEVSAAAPPRPPVLCPGCPHRGFFYALSLQKNIAVSGDIGCYTLGSAPPLSVIETVVCMGAGFSLAAGMSKVFEKAADGRIVFGVMGDSTFFHSGITGLCEIAYNGAKVIPCVLDNSATAMTGGQDNPSTGKTLMGKDAPVLSIKGIFEACGFSPIIAFDPYDIETAKVGVSEAIKALARGERPAIVTQRPCMLIKGARIEKGLFAVNAGKCKNCKKCLAVACPAISMEGEAAWVDAALCTGCGICAKVCPFEAFEKAENGA